MEIWEISIQHHSRWQQNSSRNINKIQTIRFIHSHLRELQHSVDSQFIVKVHQTHNCIIFQMFNNLYIYTHSYPYNEYIFHSNRLIIILRKEEIRITISHVTDTPASSWLRGMKKRNQSKSNQSRILKRAGVELSRAGEGTVEDLVSASDQEHGTSEELSPCAWNKHTTGGRSN